MKAFVLGSFYESKSNKGVLYTATEEGRPYCWRDETGHRPYLYSPLKPEELRALGVSATFVREEKYYPLIDSQIEVTKVIVGDPLSVRNLREKLENYGGAREANIKYFRNFIYDTGVIPGLRHKYEDGRRIPIIEGRALEIPEEDVDDVELFEEYVKLLSSPVPEIPRVALDIEVGAPGEEVPREPEYPVIAISLVSNDGLRRTYILERPGAKEVDVDAEVRIYENEVRMITDALKDAFRYPVVLTRNGDNFDLPYLAKRLKYLGITDVPIHYRTGGQGYRADFRPVKGTRHENVPIHVDLMQFFGNEGMRGYVFGGAYDDLRLDTVAKAVIGKGKVELPTYISELDAQTLVEYNLNDAQITLELTTHNNSLVRKLLIMFARISRMGIHDIVRRGISARIDSRILREHRRRNRLFPRREDVLREKGATFTDPKIKGKKYRGAIVIDPVPGIHFNVIVLDVASLYPSVIKVRNLSYETINAPVSKDIPVKRIPETPHYVRVDRKGIMSLLIGMIRDLRVKYFKPKSKDKSLPEDERAFYDAVQSALKVLINASYGVLGFERFSLYCPPVAEATAAVGRYVISRIKAKAEELGAKVIYGDTDSIFVKDAPEEVIEALQERARKELNIDLEVDKVYRYVVFTERKKNYVGVTTDGKIVIKGMLGKKRNTPEMFKKAFAEALEELSKVHDPKEFERAKERIKEIIRTTIRRLRSGNFDVNELAIRVRLSKNPEDYDAKQPHVKVAKMLRQMGYRVRAGSIVEYVYVRGKPGAKPPFMAKPQEIDVEKYEDLLKSVFEQLIEALGMTYNEILGATSLKDFLGDLIRAKNS